jgi:hypothetical protein
VKEILKNKNKKKQTCGSDAFLSAVLAFPWRKLENYKHRIEPGIY